MIVRIALFLRSEPWRGPRASPNYEAGFDDDFLGVGLLYRGVYALQNCLGRKDTHLTEWLLDGRKAGVLKRGALNVIETDDGNVLGYASACFT